MDYCINYAKDSTVLDLANEIIIDKRNDLDVIMKYIEEHPYQRVIIDVEEDLELFESLLKIITDDNNKYSFSIRLKRYTKEIGEILNQYDENISKIKFFFEIFVRDWDMLQGLLNLGVSDVYIVENLCFSIDKVAEIVHSHGAKVRVFPNIAQSSWINTDAIKKFFIRPEDIDTYEEYVDICEFFGDLNRVNETFLVYKNKKKWKGFLNEIIVDLNNSDIDNRFILRTFGQRRVKCNKRCMYNGTCNLCEIMYELSTVYKQDRLNKLEKLKKEVEEEYGKRNAEQINNNEEDITNV